MRTALVLLILSFSTVGSAYIPKFWMVMSRTAENHGRGYYKIEQLVTFFHGSEPLTVQEVWHVKDGDSLRVDVSGQGVLSKKLRVTYLYQGTKRYTVNAQGKVTTHRTPAGWFEPYFHFRYSKRIKARMFAAGMLPKEALEIPKRPSTLEEIEHDQEPYIRLSRVAGKVTYGIGTPTPANSEKPLPGLWVEQDTFLLKKLRLPSFVEVLADDYVKHSRNFWFPTKREVKWKDQRVEVKTISVKALRYTDKTKALLSTQSLSGKTNTQLAEILSDDPIINEFYNVIR